MSQAGFIDGLQFAREQGERSGVLDLIAMPRLAESGCTAAALKFRLHGLRDKEGRSVLQVWVSGPVTLVCQRCLGPLSFAVAVDTTLRLVEDQAEIDTADDEVDRLLTGKRMDVAAIVEDEAILGLPMIPAHDDCPGGLQSKEGGKLSPFAALAALKKSSSSRGDS